MLVSRRDCDAAPIGDDFKHRGAVPLRGYNREKIAKLAVTEELVVEPCECVAIALDLVAFQAAVKDSNVHLRVSVCDGHLVEHERVRIAVALLQ
jgi:hypothetical protein